MTTTDARAAVLRAVLEEPGEDLHRLAYADLCEEAGEREYAEFIRVQLRLAGAGGGAGPPLQPNDAGMAAEEWFALRHREDWLLRDICMRLQPAWWRDMLNYLPRVDLVASSGRQPPGGCVAVVRRGFVDEVRVTLGEFTRHAAALFSAHPVTRVTLADRGPEELQTLHRGAYWRWWRAYEGGGVNRPESACLPHEVFVAVHPGGAPYSFNSRSAAAEALSAGCVAWGRAQALWGAGR